MVNHFLLTLIQIPVPSSRRAMVPIASRPPRKAQVWEMSSVLHKSGGVPKAGAWCSISQKLP